jgi:DNA modification methylase
MVVLAHPIVIPQLIAPGVTVYTGDCLNVMAAMPDNSVDQLLTSPPYWRQRDYRVLGQLGLEGAIAAYVEKLVEVMHEGRRVLKPTGTVFLNLGDTYVRGSLQGIPWQVAIALINDGWFLRNDLIWHKPNAQPSSTTSRFTGDHEYVFFLTPRATGYYFDAAAIAQPAVSVGRKAGANAMRGQAAMRPRGKATAGHRQQSATRNCRGVMSVATRPFKGAHLATYPEQLITPFILAGCPEGGVVLDPFFGAGTSGLATAKHGRECIGIELNPAYVAIAELRLQRGLGTPTVTAPAGVVAPACVPAPTLQVAPTGAPATHEGKAEELAA